MKKLILLLLLILFIPVLAEQLDDIYQKVLKEYDKITTYESTLTQQNYWAEIEMEKISTGKIYYDLDSLYITYQPPDEQELYVHQNSLIVHDVKSSQVIYMDKSDFYIRPQEIIKKYWEVSEREFIEETDKSIRVHLKQQESEEEFDIWINDQYLITRVMISDKDGNTVSYQFSDEIINKKLPEGIFKPEFPANTNIIDNRTTGE